MKNFITQLGNGIQLYAVGHINQPWYNVEGDYIRDRGGRDYWGLYWRLATTMIYRILFF